MNATVAMTLTSGMIDGEIIATDEVSHSDLQQIWKSGGVCAICGGNLGPTGLEPCVEPFLPSRK